MSRLEREDRKESTSMKLKYSPEMLNSTGHTIKNCRKSPLRYVIATERMNDGYVATYLSMIHRSARGGEKVLARPCQRHYPVNANARSENESMRDGRALIIGGTRRRPACLPIRRSCGTVSTCKISTINNVSTYVSDGSGITGRLACAGTGRFVSGVLTVIVVVPPGTVDVMRRVMVLVISSSSLHICQ